MPPRLCLSHGESNRGLGGDLLEGSSYCELGSLMATVTSCIFTLVGCVYRIAASSLFLCLAGGRPEELWLTPRPLLEAGHSVGTSRVGRYPRSLKYT